jgi:hypothetical protein
MSFRSVLLFAFVTSSVAGQTTADHSLFTEALKQHVAGGFVNYSALRGDHRFGVYLKILRATNPDQIKDANERLAFWINAYNAFTLKLIIDHFPVESIRDIKEGDIGPWDIVWIEIDGKKYSLNHIEHEIIRKDFDEPRIHMALVCAAVSCPPLSSNAYTGYQLEGQLEENTRLFLTDKSKNRYDERTNTLYLSELFNWYGNDFVNRDGSVEEFVLRRLGLKLDRTPTVRHLRYDWRLNSKP